jgi:Flp pilus assembly protein TadG
MRHGDGQERNNGQRGMAMLEFALVLLVLLPLLVGMADFSLYLHAGHVLSRAARESAMAAVQGGDAARSARDYLAAAGLDPDKVLVEAATSPEGPDVTVRLRYDLTGTVAFPWEEVLPVMTQVEAAASARML